MRVATAATVSLVSIAMIAAGANIAHFGFKFFTFRESGAGETGGSNFDTNFLAQQAAAAKAAAQGLLNRYKPKANQMGSESSPVEGASARWLPRGGRVPDIHPAHQQASTAVRIPTSQTSTPTMP
jgi:hypothetical protein